MEILRNWTPKEWTKDAIVAELKALYYPDAVEVCDPFQVIDNYLTKTNLAHNWHQDWITIGNVFHGQIALWSNLFPTLIRKIGSGEVLRPKPCDIVLFDNDKYEHKLDPDYNVSCPRWFARLAFTRHVAPPALEKRTWENIGF